MSVVESSPTTNFLQSLQSAYLAQYTLPSVYTNISTGRVTPEHHAGIRRREVDEYFQTSNKNHHKLEFPRAFMSEWTVYACLSSPFADTDYHVGLAPAEIEAGGEIDYGYKKEPYKGEDILLSVRNSNDILDPFLGINVKLNKKKPDRRDERHAYNPVTRSPSINISLGDWQFVPREMQKTEAQSGLRIRDWLNDIAVPRISEGDKIPFFHDLRRFIIHRVNHTLGSYLSKADRFVEGNYIPNDQEWNLFPTKGGEFSIFYEKLNLAKQLFSEAEESISERFYER